jgi:IS605 OrfB family transposase
VNVLAGTSEKSNKYELRNKFVIKKGSSITDEKILLSMKKTPKDIRAKAVFEACTAHDLSLKKKSTINPKYKSQQQAINSESKRLESINKKINLKKKGFSELEKDREVLEKSLESLRKDLEFIPQFMAKISKLSKRRRKDTYSHIFIPKSACQVDDKLWSIFPKYNKEKLLVKEKLENVAHDFQIRWNRKLDVWHIVTCVEIENKKSDKNLSKTVIIDPGVRTFLTCLNSDGEVEEIGKDWSYDSRLKTRIEKLDYLSSLDLNLKGKRGKERHTTLKAKRGIELHRKKIQNIINELHKKTVNYLLNKYDIIVLPKLRTKTILKRIGGIGKENNRNINIISHCKFHDYLSWKASTKGKIIIDQNEAFTTKTCFECGKLNNIGKNKNYVCTFCNNSCDRDIQSCFNILTRYMSSYSSTMS